MPAVVQTGSRTRRSDPAIKRSVFVVAPSALALKPNAARAVAAVANSRRVIPWAIPYPPLLTPFDLVSISVFVLFRHTRESRGPGALWIPAFTRIRKADWM